MNRSILFRASCVSVLLFVGTSLAQADFLAWVSDTVIDGSSVIDISAAGTTDWAMPNVDYKDGGTAINRSGWPYLLPVTDQPEGNEIYPGHGSYPSFSYTDGHFATGAQTAVRSHYQYDGLAPADPFIATDIAVPAGSGTVMICWVGNSANGTLNAQLGSETWSESANDSKTMTVLSYISDTAQTLHLKNDNTGTTGANAGIFAVAVSSVPEPGSLLLVGTGLLGLLCYAWKRRR